MSENEKKYPYYNAMQSYYKEQGNQEETAETYNRVLYDFFCYLEANEEEYQKTSEVESITENEIKRYFSHLTKLSNATFDRNLTILNVFFKRLNQLKLITNFPTITMKRKTSFKMIHNLNEDSAELYNKRQDIYRDEDLTLKSRVIFLFLNKKITLSEMTKDKFYLRIPDLKLEGLEKELIDRYLSTIYSTQLDYDTKEIFLKQRLADSSVKQTSNSLSIEFNNIKKKYNVKISTKKYIQDLFVMEIRGLGEGKKYPEYVSKEFMITYEAAQYYLKLAESMS